jgi:hypothetical protein
MRLPDLRDNILQHRILQPEINPLATPIPKKQLDSAVIMWNRVRCHPEFVGSSLRLRSVLKLAGCKQLFRRFGCKIPGRDPSVESPPYRIER